MIPPNFKAQRRDRLVGHIDATLGEHILDVAVAQSEAEIEPDGLLDDDARKAVTAVREATRFVIRAPEPCSVEEWEANIRAGKYGPYAQNAEWMPL